jgi:hypothetical protein
MHERGRNGRGPDRADLLAGPIGLDQLKVLDYDLLTQAVGDGLIDSRKPQSPGSHLVIDCRRQPVARDVVIGLSE